MAQLVSLILIRWIVIYPVCSAIQLLNNRGLEEALVRTGQTEARPVLLHRRHHPKESYISKLFKTLTRNCPIRTRALL